MIPAILAQLLLQFQAVPIDDQQLNLLENENIATNRTLRSIDDAKFVSETNGKYKNFKI